MYNHARAKKIRDEQEMKQYQQIAVIDQSQNYVSHARRRAVQIMMHQSIEARTSGAKVRSHSHVVRSLTSKNLSGPVNLIGPSSYAKKQELIPTNVLPIPHSNSLPQTNDYQKSATEKKFKEVLGQQLDLLNYHRRQFEGLLSSELD